MQLDPVDLACQSSQQRVTFKTRDLLAHARMNAHAERQVTGRAALNVEFVRLIPMVRVQVGRCKNAKYLVSFAYWNAGNFRIDIRGTAE